MSEIKYVTKHEIGYIENILDIIPEKPNWISLKTLMKETNMKKYSIYYRINTLLESGKIVSIRHGVSKYVQLTKKE